MLFITSGGTALVKAVAVAVAVTAALEGDIYIELFFENKEGADNPGPEGELAAREGDGDGEVAAFWERGGGDDNNGLIIFPKILILGGISTAGAAKGEEAVNVDDVGFVEAANSPGKEGLVTDDAVGTSAAGVLELYSSVNAGGMSLLLLTGPLAVPLAATSGLLPTIVSAAVLALDDDKVEVARGVAVEI